MQEHTIIITAGGIGKRMGADLPKQFLCLAGKPILMHSIEKFYSFDKNAQLILTLPEDWIQYWKELCEQHKLSIPHEIVSGGEERFHSIQNALQKVKGKFIAIHDGVRPLVSLKTIQAAFDSAKFYGSGIPVLAVKESIREVLNENSSIALQREKYRIVQTPQVFEANLLQKAYQLSFHSKITDDASLVEEAGFGIFLVDGNEENIKITTPLDLTIGEIIIKGEE
jgi:2-C-methyl-D-erythritol 4-phosphate cytidylyltransferase